MKTRAYNNAIDLLHHSLILFTILFGTYFTKQPVFGPLYLHDACLLLIVSIASIRIASRYTFQPIIILLLISIIYLILSLVMRSGLTTVILRQYALFGYCLMFYILFNKTFQEGSYAIHIRFLRLCGIISLILQCVFVFVVIIQGNNPLLDYNYFSPAIVIGLIVAASAWMAYVKDVRAKLAGFLAILALVLTTGHSSAFLAVFLAGFTFLFLKVNAKSKSIIIWTGLISIFLLWLFLPQFQDANANWRMMIWGHILQNSITQQFGLIGNGFGVPFFDEEIIKSLYHDIGATGFFGTDKPFEAYNSTAHNFFITVVFSIGLIPALLILYPFFKSIPFHFKADKLRATSDAEFIFMALIGSTVWAAFNVVLELPHSAGLYWLIYFTCLASMETSRQPGSIPN